MFIVILLIVILLLFCAFRFYQDYKVPKLGSLVLVSGGVKCGKSTLSVYMVIKQHKWRVFKTKIKNFFRRLFRMKIQDLPLVYSNVPLNIPYVPLTDDLLLRKKRFVYGSVIYVQEASLVADSQLIHNMDVNERLLLFNKLIGHETKGGILIYDTQCISDVHYTIKRSLSSYFYIHHLVKWFPFFMVAYVQECKYSEDGSSINVNTGDVEDNLKKILIPKRTWKYFDCYCYSVMTDNLDVDSSVVNNNLKNRDLKAHKILSFRKRRVDNEEKINK